MIKTQMLVVRMREKHVSCYRSLGGVSALVGHSLCIVWSYNSSNVVLLNQPSAAMAFVAGCHLSPPYYGLHYHGLHSYGPIM